MNKPPKKCQICDSGGVFRFIFSHERWDLYECNDCAAQFWIPFAEAGRGYYEGFTHVSHGLSAAQKKTLAAGVHGRALDIGCQTGEFMSALKSGQCEVWGVDIDENAVAFARQHYGLDRAFAADMSEFLKRSDLPAFDLITAFELIEHIADPVGFMRQLEKRLAPGGRIVISTPSRERYFAQSISSDLPPAHVTRWNEKAITNMLRGTGLAVAEVRYVDALKLLAEAFCRRVSFNLVKKAADFSGGSKTAEATTLTKIVHAGAKVKNYTIGGIPGGFFWILGKLTGKKNGDMVIWIR